VPGASQAGAWCTKHSLFTTNYEQKLPSCRDGEQSDEKIVIVRGALQRFSGNIDQVFVGKLAFARPSVRS